MIQKYDIQVTITVLAQNEIDAEDQVHEFLKISKLSIGDPDIVDWEFTEFVPADLKQSCCC